MVLDRRTAIEINLQNNIRIERDFWGAVILPTANAQRPEHVAAIQ